MTYSFPVVRIKGNRMYKHRDLGSVYTFTETTAFEEKVVTNGGFWRKIYIFLCLFLWRVCGSFQTYILFFNFWSSVSYELCVKPSNFPYCIVDTNPHISWVLGCLFTWYIFFTSYSIWGKNVTVSSYMLFCQCSINLITPRFVYWKVRRYDQET